MNPDKKQLVWMCRRGAKELDQMASYYLNRLYDDAPQEQKDTFLRLLQMSDPDLQDILIYGHRSADPEIRDIADIIRTNYRR